MAVTVPLISTTLPDIQVIVCKPLKPATEPEVMLTQLPDTLVDTAAVPEILTMLSDTDTALPLT